MRDCYILLWHHGTNPRYHWYIRGINPDRSFFCEIRLDYDNPSSERHGVITNVEGRLTDSDYLRLSKCAAEVQQHAPGEENSEGCEGTIAYGSVSHPTNIYRYNPNDDSSALAAAAFRQVIEILSPYLCNYESSLTQSEESSAEA